MEPIRSFAALRARVRTHRGSYADISLYTGISYSLLTKMATKRDYSPRMKTAEAVSKALDKWERKNGR